MNETGMIHYRPPAAAKSKPEDFYEKIGRKGGDAIRSTRGKEYFKAIGAKGGKANFEKNGVEHYRAMGKKGGAALKALVEAAKRAQKDGK